MPDAVIYLDNNASTRVRDEVVSAMLPWFVSNWANPSSVVHSLGRAAHAAIDMARSEVAAVVGSEPDEVIFTSGASEANALAIAGARPCGNVPDVVVTADIEHRSVLSSCFLAEERGLATHIVRTGPDGFVMPDAIDELPLTNRSIVSVQWVNNETGAINPIAEIAAVVKRRGGLLHVDAAQAIGKVDVDLREIPIDLLTISAHKVYGPKGIGALIVRRGTPLEPLIRGGQQERGRRAGTENVAGIVGLGEACRLARADSGTERKEIAALRDAFEKRVVERVGGTIVIAPRGARVGNTSICAWEGLANKRILAALDAASICAASGSACSSEMTGPSHVLRAMGVPASVANGAVRFSFGRYNTAAELDHVVDTLAVTVRDLRAIHVNND